ncbi:MAG: sulfite exporter TauE/SafE family protein [Hyphomicrobiales bacterium]
MFDIFEAGLLAFGALLAGFVAGLTGFGTAMTALAFWLYVVPPVVAAPLAAICAIGAHVLSVRKIWRDFDLHAARPFLIGGIVGVPIGVSLLTWLSADTFKGIVGLFLVIYAGIMLSMKNPPAVSWGGRIADGVSGFIGGVLGGFSGLSGPVPTLWAILRGWGKERQRSVIQGFNMLVLTFAIAIFAFKGMLTGSVLSAAIICIPATLVGSWFGTNAYLAIDAATFRRIVLVLLCISGTILTATWFAS